MGRDALQGLVVLLVEAGHKERGRTDDGDGMELLGRHGGLLLDADALCTLVGGFGLAGLGVDELLVGRDGIEGTGGPSSSGGGLHLATLATGGGGESLLLNVFGRQGAQSPLLLGAIDHVNDTAEVGRARVPGGRVQEVVDVALQVEHGRHDVHEDWDLHARSEADGQTGDALQAPEDGLGVGAAAAAAGHDLVHLARDDGGAELRLGNDLLGDGAGRLGDGLGGDGGRLGLLPGLGPLALVLHDLLLDDGGALQPTGTALKLAVSVVLGIGRGAAAVGAPVFAVVVAIIAIIGVLINFRKYAM